MSAGLWALAGGIVGGSIVVTLLALNTKKQLEYRVASIAADSLSDRDTVQALARDARIIQSKLEQYATSYATNQATKAAQNLLREEYGLTPERLSRLESFAAEYT